MAEGLLKYSTSYSPFHLPRLNQHRGGFLPGISMWSPKRQEGPVRIVGPAYTVKFVYKDETDAPSLEQHHIDTVPAGSIIFLSSPKGIQNASYGGLMTHRARFQGALGTVVDGNIRDLEEQRRLEFPVFSRGIATPAYSELLRASEVNVPVKAQDADITINSGDIIVADLNGVVCIPASLLEQVLEMLPHITEADEKVETALKNGMTFAEASKKYRN